VVLIYLADFIPRVRAGLEALGVASEHLGWVSGPIAWDHTTEPADLVFNDFLPVVARMRALDPVTSELVRLRGASQHNCRLCKSLREGTALDDLLDPLRSGELDYRGRIIELAGGRGRAELHVAMLRTPDATPWGFVVVAHAAAEPAFATSE